MCQDMQAQGQEGGGGLVPAGLRMRFSKFVHTWTSLLFLAGYLGPHNILSLISGINYYMPPP